MVIVSFQEPTSLRQPGEITGRTVLNVFGPMGHGGRWILDSLKVSLLETSQTIDNTKCMTQKKIVLSSTTLPSLFLVDPLWGEMALSKNSRLLHLMQCSPLFTEEINMLLLHDIYALSR